MTHKTKREKTIQNHIKDAKRRIELVQYEMKVNNPVFAKFDIKKAKYNLKVARELLED